MKPWTTLAFALALALPLAGCVGGGPADTQSATDGTSSDPPTTPTRPVRTGTTSASTSTSGSPGNGTVSGNATTPGGNATGNATVGGNATGNGTGNATWQYDNRTGTVAGTAIPVLSASVEKSEAIDVANGTLNLTLNLTSTGDDITIEVLPPGCDADDCTTTVESEEGRADFAFDDPAAGEWTVTLSVSGVGSVEAEYELTVAQLVPGNATA